MNQLDLILLVLVSIFPNMVLTIIFVAALKIDLSTTDQPMSSDSPESNREQTDILEGIPYWGELTTTHYRPYFPMYLGKHHL